MLHLQVFEVSGLFSQIFFLVNVIAQSLIEVLLLVFAAKFLEEKFHRGIKATFVILTFFLFLVHCADFGMQRIMDMSIWFTLSWLMDETLHNFIEMLYASDTPLSLWVLYGSLAVLLPFVAFILYKLSHNFSKKRPLSPSYSFLFNCTFSLFLGVCVLNICSLPYLHNEEYMLLRRALPWKDTLFTPKHSDLPIEKTLKRPMSEEMALNEVHSSKVSLEKKPNIYLFITESLREDFLSAEVAPNLYAFKQTHVATPLSFSNTNNSHGSWFCIFSSKLPFYWDHYKYANWKSGSLPLQILKQMGYKVHLYTAARLAYYEMDKRIFGKEQYLVDTVCFKPHEEGVTASESDAHIIEQLCKDTESFSEEGHLFITFLDSTHFNYSWPEEDTLFTPYTENINYLMATCFRKDLDLVKNRYRNAAHYVDKLFGKVMDSLQSTKAWQDSIVVFTGDHGEEFMETKNLFHASDLNQPQTQVPIYLKLGEMKLQNTSSIVSHIDIFPTLLHHIVKQDHYGPLFDGQSLLRNKRSSFAVSSRYNASRAPFEFCINNGKYKLLLRFKNPKQILSSSDLHILGVKDQQDRSLSWTTELIEQEFGESLQKIFSEKN